MTSPVINDKCCITGGKRHRIMYFRDLFKMFKTDALQENNCESEETNIVTDLVSRSG